MCSGKGENVSGIFPHLDSHTWLPFVFYFITGKKTRQTQIRWYKNFEVSDHILRNGGGIYKKELIKFTRLIYTNTDKTAGRLNAWVL